MGLKACVRFCRFIRYKSKIACEGNDMKHIDSNNSKHLKGLADVIIKLMIEEIMMEPKNHKTPLKMSYKKNRGCK
tara:strand:+ start:8458 stop:8682 length:225 start_codon:yes stop_codon:yes gene_type:complete